MELALSFDIALGRFSALPGGTAPLRDLFFKRGDAATLTVSFFSAASPVVQPALTDIVFVLKETVGGDPLAIAIDWVRDEDTGAVTADLDLDTEPLAEVIGTARTLRLLAEFTYTDERGVRSSRILPATVENDLWKGTETTPLALPDADDYVAARAVLYDREQALSASDQEQARENIIPLADKTAVLDPAGENNSIRLIGGDFDTADIVIDAVTDRTQLSVAGVGPALVVTAGDKAVMRILASFDGAAPEEYFIPFVGFVGGDPEAPRWTDGDVELFRGSGDPPTSPYQWTLQSLTKNGEFLSNVVSSFEWPDDTDWTGSALSPAEGTPVVTAYPSTASRAIAEINNSGNGVAALHGQGSDGSGSIAAASASFAAGTSPIVPIEIGGTGATTAEGARGKLGAAAVAHTHTAGDITDLTDNAVMLAGHQTVAGQKTFTTSPRSTGTPNDDTSVLNRVQGDARYGPFNPGLMLWWQSANSSGAGSTTVLGGYVRLGVLFGEPIGRFQSAECPRPPIDRDGSGANLRIASARFGIHLSLHRSVSSGGEVRFLYGVGTSATELVAAGHAVVFEADSDTDGVLQIHDGTTKHTQSFTLPFDFRITSMPQFFYAWDNDTLALWVRQGGVTGVMGNWTLVASLTVAGLPNYAGGRSIKLISEAVSGDGVRPYATLNQALWYWGTATPI